jgi:HAD superfamily hydrolase (TIGR01549 family)
MDRDQSMKPFDAILFDLGSTLIYLDAAWDDIWPAGDLALTAELRRSGLDLDGERFRTAFRQEMQAYYLERETEFIEHTTYYILKNLLKEWGFSQAPETVLRRALEAMYSVTQAHWQPETDALPTLQALKAEGYRLALVSNAGDDQDVQQLVDKCGFRPYFEHVLTSAAAGIRKPNPRIFEMVLSEWNIPARRAAMAGDTLGADILGARNAGLFSIWITRRANSPDNRAHADTIRPDAQIATLAELPELLRELTDRAI